MNLLGNKLAQQGQIIDTLTDTKINIGVQFYLSSWSYSKQYIVALAIDNNVQLWTERKSNDWQRAVQFDVGRKIKYLRWAPYDNMLMLAIIDEDGQVIIQCKVSEWKETRLQEKSDMITFSNTPIIFATGNENKVIIWKDFKIQRTIDMVAEILEFRPNSQRLFIYSQNKIIIILNGRVQQEINIPNWNQIFCKE
ncbi:hypothetical protein pb186bvf_006151 [Paramecium bursaria]